MNINENALNLEVEYTTAKPVEGLSGLGCVFRVCNHHAIDATA